MSQIRSELYRGCAVWVSNLTSTKFSQNILNHLLVCQSFHGVDDPGPPLNAVTHDSVVYNSWLLTAAQDLKCIRRKGTAFPYIHKLLQAFTHLQEVEHAFQLLIVHVVATALHFQGFWTNSLFQFLYLIPFLFYF